MTSWTAHTAHNSQYLNLRPRTPRNLSLNWDSFELDLSIFIVYCQYVRVINIFINFSLIATPCLKQIFHFDFMLLFLLTNYNGSYARYRQLTNSNAKYEFCVSHSLATSMRKNDRNNRMTVHKYWHTDTIWSNLILLSRVNMQWRQFVLWHLCPSVCPSI